MVSRQMEQGKKLFQAEAPYFQGEENAQIFQMQALRGCFESSERKRQDRNNLPEMQKQADKENINYWRIIYASKIQNKMPVLRRG